MRYAIVIEQTETNFCAYVPDLPGCIATGRTIEETESLIREAIIFHIRTLHTAGLLVPEPTSRVRYVEIQESVEDSLNPPINLTDNA